MTALQIQIQAGIGSWPLKWMTLTSSDGNEKQNFFKVKFDNKGLGAISISNIFHQKICSITNTTLFQR